MGAQNKRKDVKLGGGIYTKAADVGADLVGKVEQGIPEDDPLVSETWNCRKRQQTMPNRRVEALVVDGLRRRGRQILRFLSYEDTTSDRDAWRHRIRTCGTCPLLPTSLSTPLVGDNVGDCAARGADLFESIAAEIISAMILGGTMAHRCKIEDPSGFILFPLVIHSFDLIVSSVGIFTIHGTRDPGVIGVMEDPMTILQIWNISINTVDAVHRTSSVCLVELCSMRFGGNHDSLPFRLDYTAMGSNIIAGISLGLESTALPVIVISIAIVSAFWLGQTSGLVDEAGNPTGGLFGTAVATMGMLSTAAYVLTMDMFGPIADNAGGIVEMSQQPESVREITDVLDAAGNTTKATAKGFAIGSAALASFLLFSAYMDEVDIAIPEVFVGGLLGSMLIFLFSAWACAAVGRTAQEVVNEVRRQFIERTGIMVGVILVMGRLVELNIRVDEVAIVASASVREMIKLELLAVLSPIFIGTFYMRYLGSCACNHFVGDLTYYGIAKYLRVSPTGWI
ncbi:pyrophosphate-energized membrane proton pump 2 isoform X1 [Tanacetum coccineum]